MKMIPETLDNLSASLEAYRTELAFELARTEPDRYFIVVKISFKESEYEGCSPSEQQVDSFKETFCALLGYKSEDIECFRDDSCRSVDYFAHLPFPWVRKDEIFPLIENTFPEGSYYASLFDKQTNMEVQV